MDNSLARVVVFDACLGTSVILTSAEVFRFIIIIIIIIYFIFFSITIKTQRTNPSNGSTRHRSSGKTRLRASNLINVIRGKLWNTSERRGWVGGGGNGSIHPLLVRARVKCFLFQRVIANLPMMCRCAHPLNLNIPEVNQIIRSLSRTNIIDTTPIIWWWNKLHWFIEQE